MVVEKTVRFFMNKGGAFNIGRRGCEGPGLLIVDTKVLTTA